MTMKSAQGHKFGILMLFSYVCLIPLIVSLGFLLHPSVKTQIYTHTHTTLDKIKIEISK